MLDAKRDWAGKALSGTEWENVPLLVSSAPFKAGGIGREYVEMTPGKITRSHIAELYGFPNTVVALLVTGAQVRLWLERSAAVFGRVLPGQGDQPLFDPAAASYGFDVISDLRWQIDLSVKPGFSPTGARLPDGGQRVCGLRYKDRPVSNHDPFVLVTNNYRAGGGGDFPGVGSALRLPLPRVPVRDLLCDLFRKRGKVDPHRPSPWSFVPIAGAAGVFEIAESANPGRFDTVEPIMPDTNSGSKFRCLLGQ